MALSLSEAAVQQVKELKRAQNLPDNVFLRMGVKGGGCSGMSYSLEFDTEIGPHDRELEIDGIKVVCDKKSYLYLTGTMLDYVQQGLTGGFTFVNPNAKSSCGYGSSFSPQRGAGRHPQGKRKLLSTTAQTIQAPGQSETKRGFLRDIEARWRPPCPTAAI